VHLNNLNSPVLNVLSFIADATISSNRPNTLRRKVQVFMSTCSTCFAVQHLGELFWLYGETFMEASRFEMLTVCGYLICNIAGSKTRPSVFCGSCGITRRAISATEEVCETLFLSEWVMVENMAECLVGDT